MSFGEYLYFKLLGVRAVSHSIAAWTGMLNRETLDWDEELLQNLPLEREQLSSIVNCELAFGNLRNEFAERWRVLKDAAWFPAIGDGAAANLGSGCVDASRVAVTVGTSSAVRAAREQGRDKEIERLPFGLWAYRITRDIELIGGALNEGGNVHAWMLQLLGDLPGRNLEDELVQLEPDDHGLTVLPFLAGERAPNWNADARGAILGLTLSTRPIEILRAGMEAVAYRLGLVHSMLRTVAPEAKDVIASGGALEKSPTWVQMIADVLNARVIASAEMEATSRGCALIALKGLGAINSFGDVPAALGTAYAPDLSRHEIYARAIERQKKWYNQILKENQ
jgi:gluconokinase